MTHFFKEKAFPLPHSRHTYTQTNLSHADIKTHFKIKAISAVCEVKKQQLLPFHSLESSFLTGSFAFISFNVEVYTDGSGIQPNNTHVDTIA